MNKPTIFLLLILMIVSCKKDTEYQNPKIELKGKTFNLIAESEIDTLIFDFNDSTYTIYQYSDRNLPYRIANFNESDFLVLNSRIIAIKKIDDDYYEGLYIGEKDTEIELMKRKLKWDKKLIYGTWIEEKYIGTDSTDFPPPPIGYPRYDWPPNYKITENQIELDFYTKEKSEIEINNSFELLTMNLRHSLKLGVENEWRIKSLTDSLMVIDRIIIKNDNSMLKTNIEKNIKLIKKR
ncbi:hypothetical protein [uncultured Marixanthomonas sp.]|uniref:hypothetical protein n=1 Tax=uncultured Marixanthomonas sp. TaxID=757245 RepID=UPI0030D7E24F|tara:strand:- start:78771 stop:79481 length:711 start_codon:yes stop_codon:yes gene_type:complete